MKERAIAEGGNAVINIQSYYKKNELSSATEYECGAGAIMGGAIDARDGRQAVARRGSAATVNSCLKSARLRRPSHP